MALTRATDKIIANADGNLNLSGIVTASLAPSGDLNVGNNIKLGTASGIITATSFSGDGSNLTSLPAGLGTALSSTQTSPLNKLYYTNEILSIGATVTVDHPATGTGAYTQYADLRLEEGADLIIEDGDDVIPDILGLGTDGGGLGAGGTGRIRVGSITNKNANGAPNFPNGLTGTAGTFSGAISAASGTITGNLGVGGVLTYEDVTNIDSVGVITARDGLRVTGIATFNDDTSISIADKIVHTGNVNTAIRFPSDNTITADIAGNEKLRINSSGQIIVGNNPTVSSGNIVHIEAPTSFNSGETIVNIEGNNATAAARLLLHNNNTGGSAHNEILGVDAGGQSTSSIRFYNTDQSNNYGEIAFGTRDNAGAPPTDRMRISKEGYVTKPSHPSFHARLINHTNATQNPLVYDNVLVNVGSHYKSSGSDAGKFVVPVAGTYFFFWEAIKNGSSGVTRIYLQKNGARTYSSMHLRLQEEGNYANGCMNVIMTLAVGDKIHTELAVGGVHASEYTHFGGYLIG